MRALSTFLRKKIEVVGAGRTDAGVHARLMVAHFDFEKELDGEQITDKLNRLHHPSPVLLHTRQYREEADGSALMLLIVLINIM